MPIKIREANGYLNSTLNGIGDNSMVLDGRYFLQRTGSVVEKATTGERIVGVNVTEGTFASDNETVAQAKVSYVPASAGRLYEVEITGGTVTVADEGKYFNLTDADTVDGTTESETPYYVDASTGEAVNPVIAMQLELVEFISATKGVFRIASL